MSILELFCSVDDFWQHFAPTWQGSLLEMGQRQRLRPTQMHPSEMMTIIILFQQSHYRTWKRLLHRVRPAPPAQQVSHPAELSAFHRVDAQAAGTAGNLSAHPIGSLYRYQLH